jgi:hypothetical protein
VGDTQGWFFDLFRGPPPNLPRGPPPNLPRGPPPNLPPKIGGEESVFTRLANLVGESSSPRTRGEAGSGAIAL